MKPIVLVQNIVKKYSKNTTSHLDYGMKDFIRELRGLGQSLDLRSDEFYAVNNVRFELNKGDSIALIGRNGCGKTTLLKIIAGLIKPTAGRVILDGKVQALIALGAGFDKRLSGRENIYNSASLMGLSQKETESIINDILEFAEIDDFIDSPVGTYSSGMYSRLGFSVAIHLKPDILLIDEILAVGDYAFQNKCFIKMHQLKKQGVSIILVSHNHTQVTQLCDHALWLDKGNVVSYGTAKEVVQQYLDFMDQLQIKKIKKLNQDNNILTPDKSAYSKLYGAIYDEFDKIGNLVFKITNEKDEDINTFKTLDTIWIEYAFDLLVETKNLNVSINIYRKDGLLITTISTLNGDLIKSIHQGRVYCKIEIRKIGLNPGEYVIVIPVHEGHGYLYRNIVKEIFVTKHSEMMHWGLCTFDYTYEVLP